MEQISFEDLYEAADFLKKEQAAFQLLKPALEETLAKDNLAPKSIFFREGSAEKSLYSSVYLFNEGCIFCRICFRGKQHYLSISSKYEELIQRELLIRFFLPILATAAFPWDLLRKYHSIELYCVRFLLHRLILSRWSLVAALDMKRAVMQ